ncbi:MAG TPA: hypothetical protein VM285_17080, partial [Polyangia bacterium]|nr:hypothetical protein [Polyangia bacterium]
GGGTCALLLLVNAAVAGMRLTVEPDRVGLRVGPWRRCLPLPGATVRLTSRAVGLTAVRVIGADGRRLYLNPAWFTGFERALAELEDHARAAGGRVLEIRE